MGMMRMDSAVAEDEAVAGPVAAEVAVAEGPVAEGPAEGALQAGLTEGEALGEAEVGLVVAEVADRVAEVAADDSKIQLVLPEEEGGVLHFRGCKLYLNISSCESCWRLTLLQPGQ